MPAALAFLRRIAALVRLGAPPALLFRVWRWTIRFLAREFAFQYIVLLAALIAIGVLLFDATESTFGIATLAVLGLLMLVEIYFAWQSWRTTRTIEQELQEEVPGDPPKSRFPTSHLWIPLLMLWSRDVKVERGVRLPQRGETASPPRHLPATRRGAAGRAPARRDPGARRRLDPRIALRAGHSPPQPHDRERVDRLQRRLLAEPARDPARSRDRRQARDRLGARARRRALRRPGPDRDHGRLRRRASRPRWPRSPRTTARFSPASRTPTRRSWRQFPSTASTTWRRSRSTRTFATGCSRRWCSRRRSTMRPISTGTSRPPTA